MKDKNHDSSFSSVAEATPETPRMDKKQPIIIQNFELLPSGRAKFKRKPLAVANLYLSAVMLSRRNMRSQPERPNLTGTDEVANDLAETKPNLYNSFGPSSSVSSTPSSKIKTKKTVTFHDGHRSWPESAAAENGDQGTSVLLDPQPGPTRSTIDGRLRREDAGDVTTELIPNLQKSTISQHPQSTTLLNSASVDSTKSTSQVHSSALTFSPTPSLSKYSSSNDSSRSDSTMQLPGLYPAGKYTTNEPSHGNRRAVFHSGFVKIHDRDGNINSQSPEDNITWYEKEKCEIESLRKASRDDSNRSHPHNNKLRHSTSENLIGQDSGRKSNQTESENNVPRKIIRVNFLKDDIQMIQRGNTTFPRHKTVNSHVDAQLIVLHKDIRTRHDSVDNFQTSNQLTNDSHYSNEYQGQQSKVEGNATFLMQYYSSLGERRKNQVVHVGDTERQGVAPYTDKAFVHVLRDSTFTSDIYSAPGLRAERGASSLSQVRRVRPRAQSCSAVERSPGRTDVDAASVERFLLGSDLRLSDRRTTRNKLLEEFIMGTMRSSSQTAVEKRLRSACRT